MSTGAYHGESPGKRFARAEHWLFLSSRLYGDAFAKRTHVVLASAEGGDVAVLKSLGVPSNRIVAIDRDADAANECRVKHPDVRVIAGDLCSETLRLPDFAEVGGVFADFCGQLCASYVDACATLAARLPACSYLSVGVMRGRENNVASVVRGPRKQRRAFRSRFGSGAKDIIRHAALDESGEIDSSRAVAVRTAVQLAVPGRWVHTLHAISYHSGTGVERGVPMQIVTLGIGFKIEPRRGESPKKENFYAVDFSKIRSDDDVRRAVIDSTFGDCTSALLNVSDGTASAWRAHATRGTYEESKR